MAKKVASVPKGYRTVTPLLVVRGAEAAIAFYADVFDATVEHVGVESDRPVSYTHLTLPTIYSV